MADSKVAIVNVRPEAYVDSIGRGHGGKEEGIEAAKWLEEYYGRFLKA